MRTEPGSVVSAAPLDERARRALGADLRAHVRGEVLFDTGNRAIYATDSSNYRQVPLGVVCPRDHDDVVAALTVAAAHDAPVLGRGAGTSLAGQACNVGVVLDFSRHMRAVLALDPDARTARVQPGVVLDDLRAAADPYALTFGPDPATHAWCTLGGMIGNNSCGTHGLYAGKTVDNVESLRVVCYGGESFEVGGYDDAGYAAAVAAGGPRAGVLGGLREIGRRYGTLVRTRYPDIPRRVSGYNLDQLLGPGRLHAARSLVGTESTCVLVTEATVRLTGSPRHRRLVVLGYPDVFAAADAVPALLAAAPLLGLEGFDKTLVTQMRAHRLNLDHLPLLPPGGGWLIAEVGADDATEADELAAQLVATLPHEVAWRRFDDPHQQRRIWTIRESALGATARRVDGGANHEGWEDAAVAPERLGTYLRALVALWREFGYDGALYGHFGDGCVHSRNNFDFTSPAGLRAYRGFVERAADLVVGLGGSLSGEHGDGQGRGELLERMYGPELVEAFRQFKAVWDPRARMNPGKVVDPYPLDTNLRHGPRHRASPLGPTYLAFAADGGSLQAAAERCVGVGRCRRDDTGVMCPSYQVTRDEKHTTRGRARMLAEMLQGEVTPATWRNDDVRDALELCLACKGCVVDCPTHVDMAAYKAEFFAHYYARRLRPRVAYALGLLPMAARVAGVLPGTANRLAALRPVRALAGVTRDRPVPRFARRPFRASAGQVSSPSVVVWPDTFSAAFRPAYMAVTVAALEALGETVAVPGGWGCCGRTLYDSGMLRLARRWASRALDALEPHLAAGRPVVVPEPSCLAAFRDEVPELLAGDSRAGALRGLAVSFAEHLARRPALLAAEAGTRTGRVLVHPHCHGRAVGTARADRAVLERLGYDVEVLDGGCCGLAGAFGYDARHAPLARRIGEEQWLPRLRERAAEHDLLVVDGFSCVLQLAHLDARRPAATTLPALIMQDWGS